MSLSARWTAMSKVFELFQFNYLSVWFFTSACTWVSIYVIRKWHTFVIKYIYIYRHLLYIYIDSCYIYIYIYIHMCIYIYVCVDAPTVNTGAIELERPHWAEIQLPCGHAGARGTEDPRPHFFSRETVHNRVGKKLSCRSLFCIFLMTLDCFMETEGSEWDRPCISMFI